MPANAQAAANTEQEQPAPMMVQVQPRLMASACNCAWITYGSTMAMPFFSSISILFMRRMSSCMVSCSSLIGAAQ